MEPISVTPTLYWLLRHFPLKNRSSIVKHGGHWSYYSSFRRGLQRFESKWSAVCSSGDAYHQRCLRGLGHVGQWSWWSGTLDAVSPWGLGLLLDMCFLQNLAPVLPSTNQPWLPPILPGSIWETGLLDPSRPASWFSSVAIVPGPGGTRETTALRSDVAHHALGCLDTWQKGGCEGFFEDWCWVEVWRLMSRLVEFMWRLGSPFLYLGKVRFLGDLELKILEYKLVWKSNGSAFGVNVMFMHWCIFFCVLMLAVSSSQGRTRFALICWISPLNSWFTWGLGVPG